MVIKEEEDVRQQWHSSEGLSEKPTTSSWSRISKPQSRLQNFSFPSLSWGNQKLLRGSNSSGRPADEELQKSMRWCNNITISAPPLLILTSHHSRRCRHAGFLYRSKVRRKTRRRRNPILLLG
ncbi:hypothetical protein KSP40_PGU019553 [Platanthera guangdongensis]|uniref:Uncharacterized protein n=1 Tax=Platanthera guangdongensis TaxID=2320717 RepID=A0ABR2LGU8_9ASPA